MGDLKYVLLTSFSIFVCCSIACDKHTCSPQVSKCQLLKECNCNMTDVNNCTCCSQCEKCLGDFYADCCDCVGLCGEQQDDWDPFASTVSDLLVGFPGLFEMLTGKVDDRWTVLNYPASEDLNIFVKSDNKGGVKFGMENEGLKLPPGVSLNEVNCTVAFMTNCFDEKECRSQCEMMGASKLRWFRDSNCCECIGSTCLDYGLSQPMCERCFPTYMYMEDSNQDDAVDSNSKSPGINSDAASPFMTHDDIQPDSAAAVGN